MRASVLVLAGSLALAAAGIASAQEPAMKGMSDMKGMSMPAAKHGKGTGVIRAIDPSGSVTLQHGAIPEVSWPAMTMTFKAKPVLLKGLKVGQNVDFDCDVMGMSAEVTAIRPK